MKTAGTAIALILLLAITACNSGSKSNNESNDSNEIKNPATENYSDSLPPDTAITGGPGTVKPPNAGERRNNKLTGIWLLQLNGSISQDGFVLKEDGTASSINNVNTLYKTWNMPGSDMLVLGGKKIQNKKEYPFSDTFKIDKITDSAFTISSGKKIFTYRRE